MNKDYMTKWYENAIANAKDQKEIQVIETKYKLFLATLPKKQNE